MSGRDQPEGRTYHGPCGSPDHVHNHLTLVFLNERGVWAHRVHHPEEKRGWGTDCDINYDPDLHESTQDHPIHTPITPSGGKNMGKLFPNLLITRSSHSNHKNLAKLMNPSLNPKICILTPTWKEIHSWHINRRKGNTRARYPSPYLHRRFPAPRSPFPRELLLETSLGSRNPRANRRASTASILIPYSQSSPSHPLHLGRLRLCIYRLP